MHPDATNPRLNDVEVIWRQEPKVTGSGHYSHRLAFSPDDKLFITSGDRQKQIPAQDWSQNLGKVIRLNSDGSVPADNPFQDKGELAKTFWSLVHRNLLGIAFDQKGRLWTHEMGPKHGDELNLTVGGGLTTDGPLFPGVIIVQVLLSLIMTHGLNSMPQKYIGCRLLLLPA